MFRLLLNDFKIALCYTRNFNIVYVKIRYLYADGFMVAGRYSLGVLIVRLICLQLCSTWHEDKCQIDTC